MKLTIDHREIGILKDFFNDLSLPNQRKVLVAAFRKASKPLVLAAKASVPKRTGKLMKAIGTMAVPREVAILVGAKKPKGSHGHLLESGTVQRRRKSGGRTGKVKGTKWFESAFNATSNKVYSTIDQEWYESINKLIKRTNIKLK